MPGPNTATYLERLLTFFQRAADVSYDNTESGLTATDVQAAIDEVANNTPTLIKDTMADLRAVSPINGRLAWTISYTDLGDGGGGEWVGRTEASPGTYTHNGGTVIVPSGGNGSAAWLREYTGAVEAAWFGSDTAAAQAALDTGAARVSLRALRVTTALIVSTPGQYIVGARGNSVALDPVIEADSASVLTVFDVRAGSVTLQDMAIVGPGRTVASSILVKGEDLADGSNTADVDLYVRNCTLSSAQTIAKITGRGFYLTGSTVVDFSDAVVLDWPASFVEGSNPDQKLETGMRAYYMHGNRFHSGSGGWLVKNVGSNAANIHGVHFVGNYVDTLTRIFDGVLRESKISDNTFIHLEATATPAIRITGGSNSMLTDNMIYGMSDDGGGTEQRLVQAISLQDASEITIDNNHIKQVGRDVFVIVSGCANISITDNTLTNVCLENDGATVRYTLRLTGAIDGLKFKGNTIKTPSMALNTSIVGNVNDDTIENFDFRGNIFDTAEFSTHNFGEDNVVAALDTDRKIQRYDGDGTASQAFTLPFPPIAVLVTCLSGADEGKAYMVVANSSAGASVADITGSTLTVDGVLNTNAVQYSFLAIGA